MFFNRTHYFLLFLIFSNLTGCALISEEKNQNYEVSLNNILQPGKNKTTVISQLNENIDDINLSSYECTSIKQETSMESENFDYIDPEKCKDYEILLGWFNYGKPSLVCDRSSIRVFLFFDKNKMLRDFSINKYHTCV